MLDKRMFMSLMRMNTYILNLNYVWQNYGLYLSFWICLKLYLLNWFWS